MGLDMYLEGTKYLWGFGHDGEVTPQADVNQHLAGCDSLKEILEVASVTEVTLDVGYWRKADAIHDWFVTNVQDGVDECQRAYVSEDDLENLRGLCVRELAGENLLEPVSGFFFGSTERDDYYYDTIRDTIEICNKAIKLQGLGVGIYYHSSW